MSSTVEQIKEKLSIVDVVSSYLKVEQSGATFKACCPFHNEKTPSFFVSPDRGTYHCFGCDKGGDIFSFVQDIEGLDFLGSLKVLAERSGVEIRQVNTGERKERERLVAVMDAAAFYYHATLTKNPAVWEYLKKRGVTQESIKQFRIGFAPEEWRSVSEYLIEKGFTQQELEKVGLVIIKDGRFYDRFRSRIMFPITDSSGRVIAFSGRIFGDESEKNAKYVNSPETELYRKSKVLYGLDLAKVAIRTENACVLVEGQMDVTMSHQAGVKNTVASSGTALTAEQLTILSRITDNLIMAFDADSAGVAATERGVNLALAQDFNVSLVNMPQGTDPADMVLEDPKKWKELVSQSQPVIDFYLRTLREAFTDERIYRKSVEKKVLPYVMYLPSKIDQAHYIARIAEALGIGEDPVREEFHRIQRKSMSESSGFMQQNVRSSQSVDDSMEKKLPDDVRREAMEQRLIGLMLWQKKTTKPAVDLKEVSTAFEDIFEESVDIRTRRIPDSSCERMIFEAEAYFNNSEQLKEDVDELLLNLKEHILRERLVKSMSELQRAETAGDKEKVAQMLELCNTISRDINSLTSQKVKKFNL